MSTHRRDSSSKRARFAPIQPPTRGTHTPPSSPFLSRSVTEMHNPSPYDSGYDSSFSTASGPGQPPSSRGNSDIDDQVDRYIRDQRVATIVMDSPLPAHNTPTPTPPAPLPHNHIDITRTIALQHRTFAIIDNNAGPPPTTPDFDTATQTRTIPSNPHSQPYTLPQASPESLPPRAVCIHTPLPCFIPMPARRT